MSKDCQIFVETLYGMPMDHKADQPFVRIGELSRRVGVSEHLLRAWELRYGLMSPARSEGGYRLYTLEDESRVKRMLDYLSQGLAAAQAAHAARVEFERGGSSSAGVEKIDLGAASILLKERLDQLDEPGAQSVLDRIFASHSVESVFREVLLPYLDEMGLRWESQSLTVAQEHFASNILRGRLAQLARGWGEGKGSTALLACAPGEGHEFALMISGILLHRAGWAITYLGTDTPMIDVIEVTTQTRPKLVLMSSTVPDRFAEVIPQLRHISSLTSLVLAGKGALPSIAEQCRATIYLGNAISAPEEIAKVIKTRN